jgi:DNA-binding NarL/FixJ family response regulator
MAESQLRVLVVDDERFFREAIREALAEAGIDCEAVAGADEALAAARDPQLAVAVVDLGLGGSGGIELLRRLREERPALRVIVLSAQADHERVLEALRLEASDYLAKPLHDEELVLAVRRALAGHGVEASGRRLRERLRRLERRLVALEAVEPAQAAAAVAEAVAELLEVEKTSVMLYDEAAGELRVVAARGSLLAAGEMDPVALGEGVAGVALALGEAMVVDDVYSDARFAGRVVRDRYESPSLAVAPLHCRGRPLGVLCATDRPGGVPLGEDELALLRILAVPVAGLFARLAEAAEAAPAAPPPSAPAPAPAADEAAAEVALAREICEVLTLEIDPARILSGVLRRAAAALGAPIAALHLIDNPNGALLLEREFEGEGGGDRERLPRGRGLTGNALQTGALVASPHPERDPRFDPDVDTPADGELRPLLCVPLRLRGKVLGVFRAFPADPARASARSGELLGALLSAAVRNVLLYRSLLETIDELAEARREGGT